MSDAPAAPPAAVCHRCGGEKKGPFVPCKHCGVIPMGAERQVAWLFSEQHLDPAELAEAARRVGGGERPDPPRALMELARRRMGVGAPDSDEVRSLAGSERLALLGGNLLFTPLVGLACWWGLSEWRPIAARQALLDSLPVAILGLVIWGALLVRWGIA